MDLDTPQVRGHNLELTTSPVMCPDFHISAVKGARDHERAHGYNLHGTGDRNDLLYMLLLA